MIRFYNGKTLRFDNGAHITDDEVWTDGGRIVYVGAKTENMPEFERELDLGGDVLMPGLKNAHTHTAMTFLRSFADDMPLQPWLYEKVFPNEAKLTPDAVYWLTKLGIMEYLSSGITASFDMYFHNDAYVQANIESGFRTVICSAMNNFDKDIYNVEREFIKFNAYDELIGFRLGIHAEYTTSMERMRYMAELAEKYKAPCYAHISETKTETDECIGRYGLSPAQLLDSIGFFKYGGGGFHCVWFSDEDIELFARKQLGVVTNPASNLKLASGIAPITRMLRAGVPVAIGTDGPSSNNALDMFREMYLTSVLQKYITCDASACPAEKVLEMACVNGARICGLSDCDDIAEGKRADLIVLDMSRPNMQPINSIEKNIIYSGSKDNVRMTMINGRILYEKGEFFIGEEPAEIYRRANAFVASIK